ncbi:unnamed protein product [Closterium sp. Yama58-4]|nr:unnamed protein product [Closterium sp. Yama58-4]
MDHYSQCCSIPHGTSNDLLLQVPIRWTPPHSPCAQDVAMRAGETGNPSVRSRGFPVGLHLRPDDAAGDFDASQHPTAGGSFGEPPIVSPRHYPLPPHPPHRQSSAESPRGTAAGGPREFPRQRSGRRAARGAADACAAVARLGGGEIILETESGETALRAVTTEPLVPEKPAVSGRPASHDDGSKPHEGASKAHDITDTPARYHDITSPGNDGHSCGSGKHSRASGGHYNLFSRSSSRDDGRSCGSGGDDAHSRGSGGDDGHSRGSLSGGHFNLFPRSSDAHSRGSGGDDGHSRGSVSGGHFNLFPRSSGDDRHSRASGGDDARSRASGGDDGHSRASGGDDAHSRASSGHYNLFSRSSTRKERAVSAATSAATAVSTAAAAAGAPGEPSPLARRLTRAEHSAISGSGDHGGATWRRESGAGGFSSGVARSMSRDSGDGGVAWGREGVRRINTPPVGHGMWGREQGGSGGECGGVRLGDVGRGDRECDGAWRSNWECGSAGWDQGERYSMGSNTSSVDNSVASSSYGQTASHGMTGMTQRFGSSHHNERESPYHTRNTNHNSPPVSHVSHGYADSASGAAAAFVPSPPGSTPASCGGVAPSHVAPSNVAPSNVAPGHVASSGGCRVFSSEQLVAATNGFHSSNLLGAGAFGQVFKGNLLGCEVAIKKLQGNGWQGEEEYGAEVHVLSRMRHPHIVFKGSLLGCDVAIKKLQGNGWQGEEEYGTEVHVLSRMRHPHIVLLMGHCPALSCLVYEFLPGGDLSQHLCSAAAAAAAGGAAGAAAAGGAAAAAAAAAGGAAGAGGASGAAATGTLSSLCRPLSWPDRIRILSEISGALLYLHQHSPPIAHRDLKPQNILLDTSLRAKLADVGLARLIDCGNGDEYCGGDGSGGYGGGGGGGNMTARVRGTVGYIDPEELVTCEVSVLGDVYALGVVMLQMLMGIPDVKQTVKWDRGAAAEVAAIAICCTNRRRASRPDLEREVHEVLMQLAEESAGCAERQQDEANSHLLCPLSKMRMREPVVAADGYTYERAGIEKWMETSNRSPITGELFAHPMLTPNNAMSVIIK